LKRKRSKFRFIVGLLRDVT